VGHALGKDHPARATEDGTLLAVAGAPSREQAALRFNLKEWGMKRAIKQSEFMFLNLGPIILACTGSPLELPLQLDGEILVDAVARYWVTPSWR